MRSPTMRSHLLEAALAFFTVAAALGAGFALFGPVSLVRLLGLGALALAALGCALQLYALREFAPAAYDALRERLRSIRRRVSAAVAPAAQRGAA